MSISRAYIDGQPWEIMGSVKDKFLAFTNTLSASKGGRIYAKTEAAVRTISFDEIKADFAEFEEIVAFLGTCSTKRFNITIVFNEDCAEVEGAEVLEYHYLNCLIEGELEYSLYDKTIEGFTIGYEERVPKRN